MRTIVSKVSVDLDKTNPVEFLESLEVDSLNHLENIEKEYLIQEILKLAKFDKIYVYTLLISVSTYYQTVSNSPIPMEFIKSVTLLDLTAKTKLKHQL